LCGRKDHRDRRGIRGRSRGGRRDESGCG
jgi:hypothetical protein